MLAAGYRAAMAAPAVWGRLALFGAALGAACASGEEAEGAAAEPRDSERAAAVEMLGVDPSDFDCESIASEQQVASIVGGDVMLSRSQFEPPRGVTRPCIYTLARYADRDAGLDPRRWSIDLDCRKSALDDGERLLAQNATRRGAEPIRVGSSGIDVDPALVFLADDAPCYVRVVGPDQRLRVELARLVAGELTAKNAPMTPVYRRTQAGAE